MNELDPDDAFRGLPLSPQQESEVQHYIHCRKRNNLPWDTPELAMMLEDMVRPPEIEDEASASIDDETGRERSAAMGEITVDDNQRAE